MFLKSAVTRRFSIVGGIFRNSAAGSVARFAHLFPTTKPTEFSPTVISRSPEPTAPSQSFVRLSGRRNDPSAEHGAGIDFVRMQLSPTAVTEISDDIASTKTFTNPDMRSSGLAL